MRFSNWLLFGAAALVAAEPPEDEEDVPQITNFNGKLVPPMLELTPNNWEKEVKASKYLMVKHYSPYCPHCIDFAPAFQTLYEFYYTSPPAGSAPKDAEFTSFYDFRFGTINCVAYHDLCMEHQVGSWPTTIVFENGKPITIFKGIKTIPILSTGVEDVLEKARPGTRPEHLVLPEPGDPSSPDQKAESASETAPEANNASTPEQKVDTKADVAATSAAAQATGWTPPPFTPPTQKTLKPKSTLNPNGVSVALSPESFDKLVRKSQDIWFVKFYAPWCHHCQKMAPSWEQMAKQMQGRLNIGEVNCEANSKLCKDVGTKGFPTMMLFKGNQRVEYQGLRGVGDFLNFAESAVGVSSGIQDVDFDSFKALEEKEEVIFLYFYDHATTSEDFLTLDRLPLSLVGHAKLVRTRDPKLYDRFKITTWPRLLVSREGRPTYYTPLSPGEMRDTNRVLNWMKSVWLPLVPELTAMNAREIMDGKIVVLGILNRADEVAYATAMREMKNAANEWMDKQIQLFQLERQELRDAKQLRIEEAQDRNDERRLRDAKNIRINMDRSSRKEVTFAWVDGGFWQRWIRSTYGIDSKAGDRVIINDEDNRRFWDQTSTGNNIVPSRTSILETLTKVTSNPIKIPPKLTIGFFHKILFDVKASFRDHPYLSWGCLLGIAFGVLSWFRGSLTFRVPPFIKNRLNFRQRRRGGHFKVEEALPSKEYKVPSVGAAANGGRKVD